MKPNLSHILSSAWLRCRFRGRAALVLLVAAVDASFTHGVPTGLQVASTPAASNRCGGTFSPSAGATSITFSNSSVAVGTRTLKVNVIGTVDNTYTDSVTIDSSDAGNASTASSATLTVINPPTLLPCGGVLA
jgi:hypothetical protein